MKMAVFLVVASCSLAELYQRFRGPCCLHHQGSHRRENLKSYLANKMVVDLTALPEFLECYMLLYAFYSG
jgi:hypothetical protein